MLSSENLIKYEYKVLLTNKTILSLAEIEGLKDEMINPTRIQGLKYNK